LIFFCVTIKQICRFLRDCIGHQELMKGARASLGGAASTNWCAMHSGRARSQTMRVDRKIALHWTWTLPKQSFKTRTAQSFFLSYARQTRNFTPLEPSHTYENKYRLEAHQHQQPPVKPFKMSALQSTILQHVRISWSKSINFNYMLSYLQRKLITSSTLPRLTLEWK